MSVMSVRQRHIRPLGRPAKIEPRSKVGEYWRHDMIVTIKKDGETESVEITFRPRACMRCHEYIVRDNHEIPCCPRCGLVFGERIDPDPRIEHYRRLKEAKRSRFEGI